MKAKLIIKSVLCVAFATMIYACSPNVENAQKEYQGLYRINVGGKYGFINEKGGIIIEPQYDNAFFYFSDSVCFAQIGDRKGLINSDGEYIIELDGDIEWVHYFENGTANCRGNNGKYGIIDKNGSYVLPMIYQKISRDSEYGYVVEDSNGYVGYVNYKGDFVVPCKYDDVNGFNEGLMVVATSSKCGYVDTKGALAIDTIYDDARSFGNGLARVKKNGKWMFIDKKGCLREDLTFDEILTGFSENRAFVKLGNKTLMIDSQGNTIKEVEADSVYGFSESVAKFKKGERFGFLDTNGTIVINPTFESLANFDNGFAKFRHHGKYGLINTQGAIVVEATHNKVTGCCDTLICCGQDSINGEWPMTYYDKNGHELWRDMPGKKFSWPSNPTKEDFIAYFDSKISDLDPIEGIYYVTSNYIAVSRVDERSLSNGSLSEFFAVMRGDGNEFYAYVIDKEKPWWYWAKKFVQIGESNAYAVVNSGSVGTSKWAEDGKLILEDPYHFEVTLRTGGNNWYNWYAQCEFIKDYPSAATFEQVQQAEWTGTGFAIADGFLATNYHVVNGAKTINVRGVNGDGNKVYKGYVVASDREHDLSIVRIVDKEFKGFENIPYCIGKSVPEVGDDIFVLGYPKTNTMGRDVKVTNGIINAASGFKGDESMYQISAPVQAGNSGGPLFDNGGNVVGVVCGKHTDAENANYAVKISYLYNLVSNSGIGIKMAGNNKVGSKSLSKKVKQIKPFVYMIECSSH